MGRVTQQKWSPENPARFTMKDPCLQGLTPEHVWHAGPVMTDEITFTLTTRSFLYFGAAAQPHRPMCRACKDSGWKA